MNRLRRNARTLAATLLLVCPSACAQGLVVRPSESAPSGAPQEPKGDAELQQELRALREQTAQLEALVQQLQQRGAQAQGESREGRRPEPGNDDARRMERERFEQEQQARKRAAADHIAQVEKRAQDEIARIKQNAQREIERIQAEVANRPDERRREPAEGSPMFVRSRMVEGQPIEERVVEVRRVQQPSRGNVQLFEVNEDGLPVRRVDEREIRGERDPAMRDSRRVLDPEIERLLDALRNRIAERRDEGQLRGRVVPPRTAPRGEQRSQQDQRGEQPGHPTADSSVPHDGDGGR